MNRKQKIFLYIFIFIVVFFLTLPFPTLYGTKGRVAQMIIIGIMLCFWPKRPKDKPKVEETNK